MSAIFISHSSKDNDDAAELRAFLESQGHRSIFLDFDPELGIPPGRDWERELYAQLRSCQAVLVLCSEHSMASHWCFAEITHAKALGKHIFPVKVGDCVINTVLTSRQVLDLTENREEAFRRLQRGLETAGIDPASAFDWDGKRPPYPGLMAFEEADAAVFFGREPEIQRGLELLNRLRQFGGARTVLVLGASGTGKSSLVRAGLLPRLGRDADRWLVVPPFRPGGDPLRAMAIAVAEKARSVGRDAKYSVIRDFLMESGEDPAAVGAALLRLADGIRIAAGQKDATVLLVIDQWEELLSHDDGATAHRFLPTLEAALGQPGSPLMVVGTMRSDFLADLQLHPAGRSLGFETLHVGPMARDRLAKVIEGPAEMIGLRLEDGLTEAMIADTETDDALPLLAFTLRELYEKCGDDRLLQVVEYRDSLGGLAGSVVQAAEAVYASEERTPQADADLRRAFRALVRVNEDGQYVRRVARQDDLPETVRGLLERFVQARLLVARGQGEDRIMEVAHEALFRSWTRLRRWLDEDREFLLWQQRLRGAVGEWERTNRDPGTLLRGALLAEAERHLQAHRDELSGSEAAYIEESLARREAENAERERAREERERAREERERLQHRSNRRLRLFLGVASVLALLAGTQWMSAQSARREALSQAREAEEARQRTVTEMIAASWKAGTYLGERDEASSGSSYIFGTRTLYDHLKAIMNLEKLQSLAPMPVFAESPHGSEFDFQSNDFGRYNPDFVRWASENVIPAERDGALRALTQPVYDGYLRDMARFYYLAYRNLQDDPELLDRVSREYETQVDQYRGQSWGGFLSGPGFYLQEAFRPYADRVTGRYPWSNGQLDWYFAVVGSGFWVRRNLDGTADEFFGLLTRLMRTYDADWLSDAEGG